jgi:hypothetical protein
MSWLDRLLERTQGLSMDSAAAPARGRLIDAAWADEAHPDAAPPEPAPPEPEPPLELTTADVVPDPAPEPASPTRLANRLRRRHGVRQR